MRLFVHHRTEYSFSQPQRRLVQLLRLTPASHHGQNVVDWRIDIDCDARLKPGRDGFGNETAMLYVRGPVSRIALSVTGEVLTEDRAGMVSGTPEPLPPALFLQPTRLTAPDEAVRALADDAGRQDGSSHGRAHRLNRLLHDRVAFDPSHRSGARDAATTLAEGSGVCQDMAHVFIAAARTLGIPARYVSGHLFRRDAAIAQEAAHAWAEAFVEGFGWIGFDPGHERCPDDAYVRVAVGLDHRDAAPVSGARIGGGEEVLDVGVRVGLSRVPADG